jgi:UDP-N-acetylmuramyl pentapeptide synthase
MRTPEGEFKNIEISIAGSHNVYNAMVAFNVGIKMNMTEAAIREGLLSYKAAKMRQNIYTVGGITVIEDCYNASPESMNAAINVLGDTAKAKGGRMIALLGDMRELGTTTAELHAGVGSYLAEKNADFLFTYGELSSENLANGAVKNGMSEKRIFPAIDLNRSGTRREELLLNQNQLEGMYLTRRLLAGEDPVSATENLLEVIMTTDNNDETIDNLKILVKNAQVRRKQQ